jgi:hypothetical protein
MRFYGEGTNQPVFLPAVETAIWYIIEVNNGKG